MESNFSFPPAIKMRCSLCRNSGKEIVRVRAFKSGKQTLPFLSTKCEQISPTEFSVYSFFSLFVMSGEDIRGDVDSFEPTL